jgi:hypothetical protein
MTAQHIRKADELARQQGVDLEDFALRAAPGLRYLLAVISEPESEVRGLLLTWGMEYRATRYVTFQFTRYVTFQNKNFSKNFQNFFQSVIRPSAPQEKYSA